MMAMSDLYFETNAEIAIIKTSEVNIISTRNLISNDRDKLKAGPMLEDIR